MHRTFDSDVVMSATEQVRDDLKGEHPSKWLSDHKNIAIVNNDDVSLFEARSKGLYCGHYFFKSRGKEAIKTAKEMLDYVFSNYPVEVLLGFTPLDKKGAIWMTRHLGFTHQGDEEILGRLHRVSTLTRKDWDELTSRR